MLTNSPYHIIPTALQKLDTFTLFDTVSSTKFKANEKTNPTIYLTTATNLNITAIKCVARKSSYSGMLVAQKAGITVIAFTNGNSEMNFDNADFKMDRVDDFDIAQLN